LGRGVATVFTEGNFQILFFWFYPEKGDHPGRKEEPFGVFRHGTPSGNKVKGFQRERSPGEKKTKLHPGPFIGDADFHPRKFRGLCLGKKEGVHLLRPQGEPKGPLLVQSPGQRSLLHAALQEGEKFVC
jgi:hypothetical protein